DSRRTRGLDAADPAHSAIGRDTTLCALRPGGSCPLWQGQDADATTGRICESASEKLGRAARTEADATGFQAAGTASGTRLGLPVRAAGHLGGTRFDSSTSDFKDHGAPGSRSRGTLVEVFG